MVSSFFPVRPALLAALALLACAATTVRGQTSGDLDLSFESGSTVDGAISAVVSAGDGKVYIGGEFASVHGVLRNSVARLNADGTVDEAFAPGTGAIGGVYALALQSDGKVLIGGGFSSYNGTSRNHIARLNSDGSLDTTFTPGAGVDRAVYALALQPDGKVLVGGDFSSYNGMSRNSVARLNVDGSLDTSFNPGTGADGPIRTLALQSDGKILVGGGFNSYNGTACNNITRLNVDGSLDTSFAPGTGASGTVYALALQPDGKVLVGGGFIRYNGTLRNRIARLNAEGSLDTTFAPGTGVDIIRTLALQSDGRVLIGGWFTNYNGVPSNSVARLNTDGSLDTSFDPGTGATSTVYALALQPDGKVLVGGGSYGYNDPFKRTSLSRLDRLNADGSLDPSFDPGTGADGIVRACALQPDGRVLIGGWFSSYNGVLRSCIARLNADGSLDTSFNPGAGPDSSLYSIVLQPDGKVLVGGWFSNYNGTPRNRIARLNTDGSLDISFDPGTGANGTVYALALQPDGKMLVGGDFRSYSGTPRNRIARLNTDGSLDSSFNPGTGADGAVWSLALQPDGKILVGGDFSSYNGTPRNHIVRLNADGSRDTSFNPGAGFHLGYHIVHSLVLQPDGKVLVGGMFGSYNGVPRNSVARLNADGSLDTSFIPGIGFYSGSDMYGGVMSLALQSDGKVLAGGTSTGLNGTSSKRIVRLNSNGSLDTNFDPGTGVNGTVWSLVLQSDGKVLLGGELRGYNGAARTHLARTHNDPAIQSLAATGANRVQWLRGGSAPEVERVVFECSEDGTAWAPLGEATRIPGGWELTGLGLPPSGHLRARGRAAGGSSIIEQTALYGLPPEIAVSGNGTDIANGDTTPGAADHTDFGNAPVSSQPEVRVFTITNSGTGNLTLTGTPLVTLGGSSAFSVVQPPSSATIAPGGTRTFQIAFAPSSQGAHTATVSIASNDEDENPFTFAIGGTGMPSDNANLSSLTLGSGVLSPAFASGTTNYTASVSNATTSIIVTPTKAQTDATIEVRVNDGSYTAVTSGSPSGALALNVGPNTVNVRITAQAGNTKTYTIAVTRSKAGQTIAFANPGNQFATATVNLSAMGGGSGNAVAFSATGPVSLSGNVLTFTGPGFVTVRANQAGNDNYNAAPEVSHTFTVTAASATVTLGNLVQTYDGTPKSLSATTVPAGLEVQIDYGGGPAPVHAGSYPVTATIANPLYAGTASGTLVIEKIAQSIVFPSIPDQLATATVNLSATGGGSGNAVTFTATGPATISSGNVLTFTGPGEVTVRANQAGNLNYGNAPQVSHTFTATAVTATLTLSRLHQVADGTAREVAVTTDPADLEIGITYDGNSTAPIAPGTYAVVASSADDRYTGTASGTLVVDDPARMETIPGGTLSALSALGNLSVPTFRIGAYEVTGSQWATVVTWAEANGYEFDGAGAAASGDHPVTGVSWSDAAKWCNARTEWENIHLGRSLAPAYRVGGAVLKSGTPSPGEVECDFGAGGHRLPTAAEWEFAARGGVGGTLSTYPGGNDPDELGWHSGNSGGTQPAGGKAPNGLGLHDLAGNATEWTWDGPSGDPAQRYLRGGSWQDAAAASELSALSGADPSSRSATAGFRLVQSLTLALALDQPGLTWETGGDGLWTAQTGTTHDGEDAAESGASATGQSSWLETIVEGPGNLRFQWKAEGTEGADVLNLSVGGTEVLAQTGAFGWEKAFVEIGEGPQILRWTHTRSTSGSAEARAWLDAVDYEPATEASVTTASATDVANTTATLGGEVLDDGGREVTERGVVYGTASAPTLDSGTDLPADEGGIGPFTVDADGLSEGTTYHVRAYATNNLGTVYGEAVVFTTGETVAFTGGTASLGREILPGGRQRFGFTLAGPRVVSFATSGGAGLRAELLDAQGNVIAVFEEGGEIAFERLLLAGNYVLEISRLGGEGLVQHYTLLLDASRVAAVRPEVAVGTTPTRLTGKLATVVSKKARPVKAHARIANRGNLPDTLAVRAGKGNAFFKVVWLAPGNVTAALTTGRYRTAIFGGGAGSSIQATVKPNKKKLTKKKGKRKIIQKKTLNLPVTVWSAYDAALKDAATIRVRTK